MLVDFHIWHYADLLLGALVPKFNPPQRNAAAYGDRGDIACAPLRSSTNREQSRARTHPISFHPFFFFFFFNTEQSLCCTRSITIWNWSLQGNIYRNLFIYWIGTVCPVWFPSSLLFMLRLPPTLSCSFPWLTLSLQCYSTREVMMRNGVIMPVVKPQAAQQMCFRDPAFVSEWIRSLLW